MALTSGNVVAATDFNTLRNQVINEMSRRDKYTFSPAGSTFPAVSAGEKGNASQINYLINALRTINASTTNFDVVNVGNLMASIAQLSTANATFVSKVYSSTSSGCASGCLGMCQSCTGTCVSGCTSCTSCTGTCTGSCTSCSGTCTGGCSSCSGSCTGSCSGCSGTCSGTCSGSCTSCSGCSGGCTSCSGCSGGCTSCSGCSGCTSCSGSCKGDCKGSCVDCENWCNYCGFCGGYTKPIRDLVNISKFMRNANYDISGKGFIEITIKNL